MPPTMPQVICLADVKPASTEELHKHEAAFRRGFTHGVATVIRALNNGASMETIDEWESGPLFDWRYVDDLKFTIAPAVEMTSEYPDPTEK
jgi:hypothetical protein